MARHAAARTPFVVATVVEVSGSCPQKPGAHLLRTADGALEGTIGGGAIEHQVVQACDELLRDSGRRTRLLKTHLTHDLGMCCGGSMSVFLEKVSPAARLVVFGAGHVAKPLASLAGEVGFDVTVVDERPEWLTENRFPGTKRVLSHPSDAADALPLEPTAFVCIATHDHRTDQEVAERVLRRPLAYLGIIGSRRKAERFAQRLQAAGFTDKEIARIRTPMGLSIGAVTPEEIAVSIVAELLAVRSGASAESRAPLPERDRDAG